MEAAKQKLTKDQTLKLKSNQSKSPKPILIPFLPFQLSSKRNEAKHTKKSGLQFYNSSTSSNTSWAKDKQETAHSRDCTQDRKHEHNSISKAAFESTPPRRTAEWASEIAQAGVDSLRPFFTLFDFYRERKNELGFVEIEREGANSQWHWEGSIEARSWSSKRERLGFAEAAARREGARWFRSCSLKLGQIKRSDRNSEWNFQRTRESRFGDRSWVLRIRGWAVSRNSGSVSKRKRVWEELLGVNWVNRNSKCYPISWRQVAPPRRTRLHRAFSTGLVCSFFSLSYIIYQFLTQYFSTTVCKYNYFFALLLLFSLYLIFLISYTLHD